MRAVIPARPPAYPSKGTLAAELEVSESTIDEMVKRGVLPRPLKLSSGCVRWCWADVELALAALKHGPDSAPSDPFLTGVRNVTTAPEVGCAAS